MYLGALGVLVVNIPSMHLGNGLPEDGFEFLRGGAPGIAQVDFVVLAAEVEALLFNEGVQAVDGGRLL